MEPARVFFFFGGGGGKKKKCVTDPEMYGFVMLTSMLVFGETISSSRPSID